MAACGALPPLFELCRRQVSGATIKEYGNIAHYAGYRHRGLRRSSRLTLSAVPGGQLPRRSGLRAQGVAEHHSETATSEAPSEVPIDGTSNEVDESAIGALVTERPDLSGVSEWELDFCSRPLLDERGKRVWELLVCDASRKLQYSEYFPSNKINSATLKDALLRVMDEANAPKPQKIRFFR